MNPDEANVSLHCIDDELFVVVESTHTQEEGERETPEGMEW